MTEEAALLAAIVAAPDEDTPRLAYADWLDENRPDRRPSPAEGPSARAEFIRVQCRLAAGAFHSPEYPELLERHADLSEWLRTHTSEPDLELGFLLCSTDFGCDQGGMCSTDFGIEDRGTTRRGFAEILECQNHSDTATETVEAIVEALAKGFRICPARTLKLEDDAMTEEIALLSRHPIIEQLRGLHLDGLADTNEDEAIGVIASSRWVTGLRRLCIDYVALETPSCEVLAGSKYLRNLEELTISYPITAKAIKAFGQSRWFRKLRRLHICLGLGDGLRALADLPAMSRLVSLTLSGAPEPSTATVKRFAACRSFPALSHLYLDQTHFSSEHIALLMRGRWPLRHLRIFKSDVRRMGVEALVRAPFAPSLRVLELRGCELMAGAVQELASSESLAGLRHLNLNENPIGPGGLAAIAASKTLSGLRSLGLAETNTARQPIAARDVCRFLSSLRMPELRHLALSRLPVGARGARVVATSPTLANLTRLHLENCTLGESGTKHLVGSTTLSNLVVLEMFGNKTGRGAGKLLNPQVLPRLGKCSLGTGIPKRTATRLRRRPAIVI